MNFDLEKKHEALREKVRAFAEKEIRPVAKELDEKAQFSVELTRRMGELGLMGMFLPETYGGAGADTLSYIIAVEELARIDSSQAATLAAHNSLGIAPIFDFGTEEQKRKYLPELCTGNALWAFALTEKNAGSDSRGTETFAKAEGDSYQINGSKMFITNASTPVSRGVTAQVLTESADGSRELTAFLVEHGTPGYSAEPMMDKLMWRASNTSRLHFRDCRVGSGQVLGKPGQGSKIMLHALNGGRLSISAMGVGLAQGAFELALAWSKERRQFGKPIVRFENVSFKLAEMAMKIEHARTFLYKACWLKDQGRPYAKESAMTKLYSSEVAKEVADEAIQIHGGYGLMKDNDIERFYRDQRLLQIGEGTSEIQKLIISRML